MSLRTPAAHVRRASLTGLSSGWPQRAGLPVAILRTVNSIVCWRSADLILRPVVVRRHIASEDEALATQERGGSASLGPVTSGGEYVLSQPNVPFDRLVPRCASIQRVTVPSVS